MDAVTPSPTDPGTQFNRAFFLSFGLNERVEERVEQPIYARNFQATQFLVELPPRPYLPNIIEVGAMHVRDPKSLPKDLQTFMESAVDGVVFVSFGSGLDPSLMLGEKISMFLETFRDYS